MKTVLKTSTLELQTRRVSFCSAATEVQKIEIAGQVLTPNEDTAYVEFFLSHAYPVINKYQTAIHPQVVANSWSTLNHKVFNLAHLIRMYDPKRTPRDRILGTVIAVEFTGAPGEDGKWALKDKDAAPGIRGVAAMHKAAENVIDILKSWFTGDTPMGSEWSVSLENQFYEDDCGFLVQCHETLKSFAATTPAELLDLDLVYVPCKLAPDKLLDCLNNEEDDVRDGFTSTRICRDYKGSEVLLLLGGLDNKVRYRGVALTSANGAREKEARVSQMLASEQVIDAKSAFEPLETFGQKIFG